MTSHCLTLFATGLLIGTATLNGPAEAGERRVYYYGYAATPVDAYGRTYGYAPSYGAPYWYGPVYGYVAGPDTGARYGDNRALGTYVPRSEQNLSESRHFFRGVARQSGGD